MRKNRFRASLLGVVAVSLPFSAGFTRITTQSSEPLTGMSSLIQVPPEQQTWEEHLQEVVRRLRGKLGDPGSGTPVPLKTAVVALSAQLVLFGLPPNLSADDLSEMEADAAELANCAELEPKPPLGTDFGLVVFIHDLGCRLLKSIDQY